MKCRVFKRARACLAAATVLAFTATAHGVVGWYDDFNDGDAEDGNPLTWTFNEVGATPGIYDASSGDYILSAPGQVSPPTEADDDSLVASVDVSFEKTYARTQAVIQPGASPDETGGNVGLVWRFDVSTFSGYAALLDHGELLTVVRSDFGEIIPLGTFGDLGIDALTDVVIEVEANLDEYDFYIWDPSEKKPDSPIASVIDSTYLSGRAGIVYNEDDDNTAGVFRWAAAQDEPFRDLTADFDKDNDVDGDDFLAWQSNFGTTTGATQATGDTDGDGDVDGDDFLAWQTEFGGTILVEGRGGGSNAIPEPTAATLACLAGLATLLTRRSR